MSHRRKGSGKKGAAGGAAAAPGGKRRRDAAPPDGRRGADRPRRALQAFAIGVPLCVVALTMGLVVVPRYVFPTPEIAIPANLEQLNGQARAYITGHVQWVGEEPRDGSRHAVLGLVYEANEMWEEASASFATAARLDDDPLAHYHHAVAVDRLGERAQAIELLRQLVARFPDFPYAHHRLGVLLLEEGSIDEAVESLQRTIELAPDDAAGYVAVGDALLRQRNPSPAAVYLERAVQLNPRDGTAHFLLSQAYRALGRTEDATREARLGSNAGTLTMVDPWSRELPKHAKGMSRQMRRATAFLGAKRYAEAAQIMEEMLAWHPDNVDIMNNLSIAYMGLDQLTRARDLLLRAVRTDDTHYASYANLARCQLALGEYDAALRSADLSVTIAPDNPDCHRARAACLTKLERHAEAREALSTAARLTPETNR